MKQFLKTIALHTLLTFISGIILLLLILVGVTVWESMKFGTPAQGAFSFKKTERVNSSEEIAQDLEIIALEQISDLEKFTVKGKIKNLSNKTYFNFHLELEYAVEDIKMGECGEYAGESRNIKQGETLGFIIQCYNFKPKKLPSQFSYKVDVASAIRYID